MQTTDELDSTDEALRLGEIAYASCFGPLSLLPLSPSSLRSRPRRFAMGPMGNGFMAPQSELSGRETVEEGPVDAIFS